MFYRMIYDIVDTFMFIVLAVNVIYLLVYSIASLIPRRNGKKNVQIDEGEATRFAVVIAAYREDAVIEHTVKTCLAVDYPKDKYDVVVISDHMQADTNERLRQMPIKVLQVDFDKSSNTRSLKAAVTSLSADDYDVIVIVDADNLIPKTYLKDLNAKFADSAVEVVQTHRVAKNINTDMAYLDAISEEINNSIFRQGHANLGMSAALIGSGMAFRYNLFKDAILSAESVGGFDRELELRLLFRGVKLHYLPDTCIKDEKIQQSQHFYKQRRRWLAAQYESLGAFALHLLPALRHRRWDFCDKLLQQAMFSRVLLLGIICVITIVTQIFCAESAVKWWILLGVLVVALLCAVPRRYYTRRLLKAVCLVPLTFGMMLMNLFRLKEATQRFIHTEHGIKEQQ